MRRSFKKPRIKKYRPPKPIPAPKPERPRRSNLNKIYHDLLTADRDQRVEALIKALTWYDHAVVYVEYKSPLTTIQLRKKNAGGRNRAAGIGSLKDDVKEEYYIKAIQEFEKMVVNFKPPLIGKYLKRYNRDKKKLEIRRKKLKDKFSIFLEIIQQALCPVNTKEKLVDLRVDKLSAHYRIDSQGNVTFDRKFLNECRREARKYGLLTAILKLFPILSQTSARIIELDQTGHRTGRTLVSSRKRYDAVLYMLNRLNQYGLHHEAPRKLIRRVKPKKETTQ
jgi:hypothetical protein